MDLRLRVATSEGPVLLATGLVAEPTGFWHGVGHPGGE